MITRHYKPDFINSVINDPSVKEGAEIKGVADVSAIVENLNNFILATEFGGFVVIKKMPALYECHTQFLPEGRGAHALEAIKEALRYMFIQTDCVRLVTKVAVDNRPAQFLIAQFFKKRGKTGGHFYYSLDFDDWVITDDVCAKEGHAFHEKIRESVNHEEDSTHDAFVGASFLMARGGNVFKAQLLYNRWAVMSGYEGIAVLSETPLTIAVGTMRLALEQGGIVCL